MDSFILIWSIVTFVENRLAERLDYEELARSTGFSLAHIRDVFRLWTGRPLSAYVLERRIANAAFALLYTDGRVTDIAGSFGFTSHDSFTRAFRRVTGITPTQFRLERPIVSAKRLCAGVFGPSITEIPKNKA